MTRFHSCHIKAQQQTHSKTNEDTHTHTHTQDTQTAQNNTKDKHTKKTKTDKRGYDGDEGVPPARAPLITDDADQRGSLKVGARR